MFSPQTRDSLLQKYIQVSTSYKTESVLNLLITVIKKQNLVSRFRQDCKKRNLNNVFLGSFLDNCMSPCFKYFPQKY